MLLFLIGFALLIQLAFSYKKIKFDPKSAVISTLSIAIILKSNSLLVYISCIFLAIGSKFLIRVGNKHAFNPANFGIVISILVADAWISPSSFNNTEFFWLFLLCAATIVLSRSLTYYTSAAFLMSFIALLYFWNLWLVKPISILMLDITQPTLLIFAFFMISDPKTAPISPVNQVIYGCALAIMAFVMKYLFYISYGILYSLFIGLAIKTTLEIWFYKRYGYAKVY